jgi:heat shock protein HslJ
MRNGRHVVAAALAMLVIGLVTDIGAQESPDPLDGTRWDLFAYRKTRPIAGRDLTVRFDSGRIWGEAGCNRFEGSYAVQGDSVTVSNITAEGAECEEPEGIMEQEEYYLRFLSDARTYKFVGGQLRIQRWDREQLTYVPRESEE